jgi:hypothetical protein
VSYHGPTGRWWVNVAQPGGGFTPELWTAFNSKSGWEVHLTGDFNGDGRDDTLSYHGPTGRWWVNVAQPGGGFTPELWRG